jgi:hypothetical protein
MGRSRLHEVANYFKLSHHTAGPKNKTASHTRSRRFILYPKTLFVEKQEREKTRLLAERRRMRQKICSKDHFTGMMPEDPQTFTEMVCREIYEEKF